MMPKCVRGGITHRSVRDEEYEYGIIWYLWLMYPGLLFTNRDDIPDSKVDGANMGPIWVRQDPGGSHVDPMNFAIWDLIVRSR